MLSVVAALPTSQTLAAATCAEDAAASAVVFTDIDGVSEGWDESVGDIVDPVRYATPAAIDCRVPLVTPVLLALVGECGGVTVTDTSYRASRLPESEAPAGSFSPVRSDATAKGRVPVCSGLPASPGAWSSPPSLQPVALFALPDMPRLTLSQAVFADEQAPHSAQTRRLERPPRV
ncbi:MAG TPA: hypothetical protein VNO55_15285 [Polyangia bacterium]|nr:hypothetical protein [Polyangia bacterium]